MSAAKASNPPYTSHLPSTTAQKKATRTDALAASRPTTTTAHEHASHPRQPRRLLPFFLPTSPRASGRRAPRNTHLSRETPTPHRKSRARTDHAPTRACPSFPTPSRPPPLLHILWLQRTRLPHHPTQPAHRRAPRNPRARTLATTLTRRHVGSPNSPGPAPPKKHMHITYPAAKDQPRCRAGQRPRYHHCR